MTAQHMLNQLKAAELKQLCKEEGLAHNGTKSDLIQRIVQHRDAREGSAPAPTTPKAPASPARREGPGSAAASAKSSARGARGRGRGRPPGSGRGSGRSGQSTPTSAASQRGRGRATGGHVAESDTLTRLPCKHCHNFSELGLSDQACKEARNSFICLECRVRAMDPFNPISTSRECSGILYQSNLKENWHRRKHSVSFHLDLPNLRQWRRDGLQIELRMVRITTAKVCHVWPHELTFSVNKKEVFSVIAPEEGHKRRDVPQMVTQGLSQGGNQVEIDMTDPNLLDGFAFALVLSRPCELTDLAKEVRHCGLPEARNRVQAVLAKLQGQGGATEDMMCITENKLKLLCPLTMERVQEPVRGEHCQHLQCYSLNAYLTSNRKMSAFNNRWVCPLCSLILRPTDLRLDAYVAAALRGTTEEDEEVVILADGSWRCSSSSGARPPEQSPSQVDSRTSAAVVHADAVDLEDSEDCPVDEDMPLSALSLPSRFEPSHPAVVASPVLVRVGQATPTLLKRRAPVASPARPPDKRRCPGISAVEAPLAKISSNPLKPFAKQSGNRLAGHEPIAAPFGLERATSIVVDLE